MHQGKVLESEMLVLVQHEPQLRLQLASSYLPVLHKAGLMCLQTLV